MAKRILMIEDDREMVTLGKLILEREGYEVLVAYAGADGLDLLRQEDSRVDLLLLDIILPGMNGYEIAPNPMATCRDAGSIGIRERKHTHR